MRVLKFGAVWCNGCLVMKPRWEKIEAQFPKLKTTYYDFDQSPSEVKKYHIENGRLPTFIFLDKHNQEIMRLSGEIAEDKLIKIIQQNLDK